MNETIKSILERRSTRSYKEIPVENEKISIILQCGQYAASGMDIQPWHFTVITNRNVLNNLTEENKKILINSPVEGLRLMVQNSSFDSFNGSPMAIIVSGKKNEICAVADCANAVENMAIAAQSLGLASCYLASFKFALEDPNGAYLLKELNIPDGYVPLYGLSLGYGNETLGERSQRKENSITYIQ